MSAKEGELALLTQATTAAETAVADQRDRVQALVTAKATQAEAKAAWGERKTAAEKAKLAKISEEQRFAVKNRFKH